MKPTYRAVLQVHEESPHILGTFNYRHQAEWAIEKCRQTLKPVQGLIFWLAVEEIGVTQEIEGLKSESGVYAACV